MEKTIPIILIWFLLNSGLLTANGQVSWEKLFVQSNTDVFRCVREIPGGGYIAAGYTSRWSANDTDAFVVRFNPDGDTLWTAGFNGGKKELFYKVIVTTDGGFVMCGYSSSYSAAGDEDAYYVKVDGGGNEIWNHTYGGTGKERAQDIIKTADGGYAVAGYTNSGTGAQGYNSFLLKLNANGTQDWDMKYGGSNYDDANAVRELPSGDFIMTGQTLSSGSGLGDIWLVKTDPSGSLIWEQTIGTAGNENAESLQPVAGGGFILCGSIDAGGNDNGYLVKTDGAGNFQWDAQFGGSWPDDFHQLESTADGGFILCGTTQSNAQVISDIWLFKTDANGDSLWSAVYGGVNHDHGYSAMQTADGGYIAAGYAASFGFNYEDALLIKTDANGNIFNHLVYTTVTGIVSPAGNGCGSANAALTVTLRNFGDSAVSGVPVSVEISGSINRTLSQVYTSTMNPSGLANFTFDSTIQMLYSGPYHFYCITQSGNDVYPAMNSFTLTQTVTDPGFSFPSDTIVVSDTAILLQAGPAFNTYLWSTGETTSSILIQGVSGNYCVLVTDANGCEGTDCCYVGFVSGINDPGNSPLVLISPNPSYGVFNLELNSREFDRIDVLSIDGRLIFQKKLHRESAIQLDLRDFPKGMYLARLVGGTILHKRLISN